MTRTIVALLALLAVAVAPMLARAQTYAVDQAQSDGLTNYLHDNILPLVGAEVADGSDGSRRVMLYGFVGNAAAAVTAAEMALKYLNDPSVTLINRIKVDATIDASAIGPSPPSAAPSSGSSQDSWGAIMDDIYQEGAQTPPAQGVPTLP